MSAKSPIVCAFGTRHAPEDIVRDLVHSTLGGARLEVVDHGLRLYCDGGARDDATARAVTALRARFSPLTSVTVVTEKVLGFSVIDRRERPFEIVALAEVFDPREGFEKTIDGLFERLGISESPGDGEVVSPRELQGAYEVVSEAIAHALRAKCKGVSCSVMALVPAREGWAIVGDDPRGSPKVYVGYILRPDGVSASREAVIIAATRERWALERFALHLGDAPVRADTPELYLDGLAWKSSRRPTIATSPGALPIIVDAERCTSCGLCEAVCPTGYLGPNGAPSGRSHAACTRCHDCIEACPVDALRPSYDNDSGLRERALAWRAGWLSRLAGGAGPSVPAVQLPGFLLPRADRRPPRYVLGLAVMTLQEHAAVLLRDGEIIGAIENERLVRVRHAGWHPPGREGVTAAVDPTLCLEEILCRRPVRALLEREKITLDDIDLFAVNGLHGRYVDRIDFTDAGVALGDVRAGRVMYIPHHLCHAASALRASGVDSAWVLTIDGRGDRECATVFRADDGELRAVDTLLALDDRSIGGVYEGITRLLGFGSHGQGSVMALAAFGVDRIDVSAHLGVRDDGTIIAHESGLDTTFARFARSPDEPIGEGHRDLAASVQKALERVAIAMLRRVAGDGPLDALCVAGGVALNCSMNEALRTKFSPGVMFVQPAANDAGTALGAALEAWRRVVSSKGPSRRLSTAGLGPDFGDREIVAALERSGLEFHRSASIEETVAELLTQGEVVCWFQGEMEFGPRALGARSIVADPRKVSTKARVNAMKEREPWRPFGPSIIAGRESDWLEKPFDSRFMLFNTPVRPEKREQIAAVVHVDGTTRPQVVHESCLPRYHAMITAFERHTGVPMVLDTSFNRRGEPMVCTPEDALEAFVGLGADALAIGDYLVRPTKKVQSTPSLEALTLAPRGRRLSLRLTARCDFDCVHCTARDLRGRPDRSTAEALEALAKARLAGCDEVVFLRGEASLRRDLVEIIFRARAMGYRFVQLQTDGHALATVAWREALVNALDAFEVQLIAADALTHDRLTNTRNTFNSTLSVIQHLARSGRDLLVTVPLLRATLRSLPAIVALAHKLGARRVQFNFPRPVELDDRVELSQVPRLSVVAKALRPAALAALRNGMTVTTEAVPVCCLPEELRSTTDAHEDFSRHRIDDFTVLHDRADTVRQTQRPMPPPCRECSLRDHCGRTWALYFELFGSAELRPV